MINRHNLRGRLARLEKQQPASPQFSWWDMLTGAKPPLGWKPPPDILKAFEAGRARREESPAMKVVKAEYRRLGWPDIDWSSIDDPVEEAIRLAGIPTPAPLRCGLKELSDNPESPEPKEGDLVAAGVAPLSISSLLTDVV